MRRAIAFTAAAAVLLLLAACGSKDADAAEVVRQTADKTAAAGSARVALRVNFSSDGRAGSVTGDGVVDLRNGRGAIELDLGALGGAVASGTVQTVLQRDGIFVRLPPSLLTGSKPWIKLDLSTLAGQAGVNLGSLGQLQSADPTQALQFLKGAVGDMRKVSEESVRGTDTTHYRGTLDLRRASEAVSSDVKEAIDQAVVSLGTSTFPADVWVDEQGRMRKMSFTVDPDGTGPTAAGTVEFEMYEFGVAADVQPPPADQVTDLSRPR